MLIRHVALLLQSEERACWQSNCANHAEACRDVTDYIVGFYKNVCLYSTLVFLPPTAFERENTAQLPIEVSDIT